jgi:hypothetical protein
MENKTAQPDAQQCGPGCTCKPETEKSKRVKFILAAAIIICSGAVLANSIIRKSRQTSPPPAAGYASALSNKAGISTTPDSAARMKDSGNIKSVAMLTSLSSLDMVASQFDGVFILMVKSDAEKTPYIFQEIESATTTIQSQGLRMGAFQLAAGTPDFEALSPQLPSPGILVIVKGRGMRGVSGADITQTKLLQACFAAMLPSGCGPGACQTGSASCKKPSN